MSQGLDEGHGFNIADGSAKFNHASQHAPRIRDMFMSKMIALQLALHDPAKRGCITLALLRNATSKTQMPRHKSAADGQSCRRSVGPHLANKPLTRSRRTILRGRAPHASVQTCTRTPVLGYYWKPLGSRRSKLYSETKR